MIYSLDIETTCGDPAIARVVEYALVSHTEFVTGRCNPGVPIQPEATAIHRITDETVAHCPPFAPAARRISHLLSQDGAVLVGHSPYLLDLPVLAREFEIAEVDFDWQRLAVIDTAGLEAVAVSRKLADVYQRMFLKPLDEAHGATSDAMACLEVFEEMRHRHAIFRGKTEAELALLSNNGKRIADPFGKLCYDEQNRLCYNFGQRTRGVPVLDDTGFAFWVLDKDFPACVKSLIREELDREARELLAASENQSAHDRATGIPF